MKQEYRGLYLFVCFNNYRESFVVESMSARNAAEAAGRSGTNAAKASSLTGMSLGEAKQILNVKDLENLEAIKKVSDTSVWLVLRLSM